MNCLRCGRDTEEHGLTGECPVSPTLGQSTPPEPKPVVRFRTQAEFEAYYIERYPWLSKQILPHAAWQLALDILYTTDAPGEPA